MWSFTFFFFNKRLKRIVMFMVRQVTAYCEDYEEYNSQESLDGTGNFFVLNPT